MSGWSDDESATPAKSQPAASNNDDWGESEKKFENMSVNDSGDRGEDRGGRGGRGRGRGRGRGGNFGNRGDRDGESGENSDRPRRFNRDNNDGDGGDRPRRFNRDNDGEGGDRPPRRFNRDNDGEGGDRPPRRNRDDGEGGEENGEEKPKREIYIPPEDTTDENEMFATAISAGINFDKFDNIEVSVTGNGAAALPPIETFKQSGLREFLLQNVEKSGYKKPTPIQKYAIPIINAKRDLMGCAQTGSGKTAAFVLPILNNLMNDNDTLNPGKPQCLIVAPTRELVIQIRDEARKFALNSYIKVCLAYGGAATRYQGDNITQGCHLLVATPGRLLDFVNKSIISFEDLKFLVLDEADRMLDMGFLSSIEQIRDHPTLNKDNLTTLMFSATFPDSIQHLAGKFLRDYLFLTVGIVGGASTDVEQEFMEVAKFKKRDKLIEILNQYVNCADEDRILIFVETKKTADFLASFISETKISSTSIHGDRLQREREEALRDFRTGKRKVLIATAVAARGLDIKGVTHVINYDLPKEIDEYVHRIGRTGRVGNRGKATSFYDAENSNDSNLRDELVRILKTAGQPVPAFLGDSSGGALGGDQYGGTDIRAPVATGQVQVADDGDW